MAVAALRHLGIARRTYRSCPPGVWMRVAGRCLLCPFEQLLALFPAHGRILEVGCGDGLLFALMAAEGGPERRFTGVDIDARKVRNARLARIPRADFIVGSVEAAVDTYSAVAIVDALYLIPTDQWSGLLRRSLEMLAPGGVLVIKDATTRPRWKYWFSIVEELIAVHVVGMTRGQAPHFEAIDTFRQCIRNAGGTIVKVIDLSAWRTCPHVAFVVGRRA